MILIGCVVKSEYLAMWAAPCDIRMRASAAGCSVGRTSFEEDCPSGVGRRYSAPAHIQQTPPHAVRSLVQRPQPLRLSASAGQQEIHEVRRESTSVRRASAEFSQTDLVCCRWGIRERPGIYRSTCGVRVPPLGRVTVRWL